MITAHGYGSDTNNPIALQRRRHGGCSESRRTAYWRLHYHFVWATFERFPWLSNDLVTIVHASIRARAQRLGVFIHDIGGIEDHVHVVASVPPKVAVAECIGQFNGASSHGVNERRRQTASFRWQTGYGALSLGERSLPTLIAYVHNQHRHHSQGSLVDVYERIEEEDPAAFL